MRGTGADLQEKSLHEQIRNDVERHIMSGEWPPGYRIPFEHEMTRQYACSRMTVNKALGELVQRGLIERRRRLGSFVRQPHAQSAVLEIHDIEREVQALGLVYRYRLDQRRLRPAGKDDGAAMALAADAPVLELTCTHFAGGVPFCLEERLINVTAVPEAEFADFSQIGPGTWLLKMVPWALLNIASAPSRPTAKCRCAGYPIGSRLSGHRSPDLARNGLHHQRLGHLSR